MTNTANIALEKPNVYESKRIRLISPLLHIGSEVSQLSPFEYVATSNRVYLPNSEALARALQARGRLQDYIDIIKNNQEIEPLLRQTFGEDWRKEKDSDDNLIFPKNKISDKWTEEKITDLRPMIRNGFGELYIPGSSIKGAIRTAIAYYLLKNADQYQIPEKQRVSEIELRLREKLDRGDLSSKFKQKNADDQLFMDELFTNFQLIYQGETVKGKISSQNTDFMRTIHVTDCTPLVKNTIQKKNGKKITYNVPLVAEVYISSHFEDYNAKYRAPIFAEMVWNIQTDFTLSLDTEMLSWFRHQKGMQIPFYNLDELLNICKSFAQEQWDGEHDYWDMVKNNNNRKKRLNFDIIRDFYEPETCPYHLRLGWGSGMNGTTIDWLLQDEIRQEIRDNCGIAAPGFEAPKSRRTVLDPDGNIHYVPGWVKFKEL